MSFLKKRGREIWVEEVKGKKYVPGYWYTYTERVPKFTPDTNSGDIYGAKPKTEKRSTVYIYYDGKQYLQLSADY